ncbi:response regulator [Vreelandella massiliensis]|uniref:response regulator n=1 Tax=Vreelandella massiliensis TaxID=1816686 RepID=UPI00096A3594|nr:response regulator [Halomonas massiliensis]
MTTPEEAVAALNALRAQFIQQLPERLDAMRRCLEVPHARSETTVSASHSESLGLDTLHTLAHRLTGTAGTFGMPTLSRCARTLERRAKAALEASPPLTDVQHQGLKEALDALLTEAHQSLTRTEPSLMIPAPPPSPTTQPLLFILEDDSLQLAHLTQALEKRRYRVQGFTQIEAFQQALSDAKAELPAVVIIDMVLDNGTLQGAELIQRLRLGGQEGIPTVVISVRDDLEARLAALRAGACRYLTKPVEIPGLIQLLDSLSGRQPPKPYRVLLVDDDPVLLESQTLVLESAGMEVFSLAEPMALLNAMETWPPDVVVLDVHMPEVSGPELAAVLRERDNYLELPILFLSAETDLQQQLHALNLGGDDFLVKPVDPEHFIEAVAVRARRSRQHGAIRKRLETSLYERQREHLTLNHHAIVSVADRDGNIIEVNERFCQISGYSREELMGRNHRIVKSGMHSPAFYHDMWQTICHGNVWQGEICNRCKDGKHYWVESTITPFLDETGNPYQYVSIRTDITQLKQAELDLKAREQELTATLDATQDGILAVAPDRRVRFANDRFRQLWDLPTSQAHQGMDEREHLKAVAHKIVSSAQSGDFFNRIEALYQTQETFHNIEPFRDSRRLQTLRGWSYE